MTSIPPLQPSKHLADILNSLGQSVNAKSLSARPQESARRPSSATTSKASAPAFGDEVLQADLRCDSHASASEAGGRAGGAAPGLPQAAASEPQSAPAHCPDSRDWESTWRDAGVMIPNANGAALEISLPLTATQRLVHPFHGDKSIYCAFESRLPLPKPIKDKWESDQLHEVQSNLASLRHKAKKMFKGSDAIIEVPDLRLSGRAEGDRVYLKPTVWVLCGSISCQKKMRRWLQRAAWVARLGYPLEIHTGTSKWSGSAGAPRPLGGINLGHARPLMLTGNNTALYAHLGHDVSSSQPYPDFTVCFTAKKGTETEWHHFSRVGGVVRIGGLRYAITTAHGMLKEYYDEISSPPPDPGAGDWSETPSESEGEDQEDSTTPASEDIADPTHGKTASPSSTRYDRFHWQEVVARGPVNFLGIGSDEHGLTAPGISRQVRGDSGTRAPPSDFALLDGSSLGDGDFCLTASIEEDPVASGMVDVILSDTKTQRGYLLPQKSGILTSQAWMTTRKIELESPLEKGTSGSWVMRGDSLVGMVVAVYEHEPFAQIITAEKLLSDIRSSFPFAVDVSLARFGPADQRSTGPLPIVAPPRAQPPESSPASPGGGRVLMASGVWADLPALVDESHVPRTSVPRTSVEDADLVPDYYGPKLPILPADDGQYARPSYYLSTGDQDASDVGGPSAVPEGSAPQASGSDNHQQPERETPRRMSKNLLLWSLPGARGEEDMG